MIAIRRTVSLLFVLVLFATFPILITPPSLEESKDFVLSVGENWLNGWHYRKQVNIDSGGDGQDLINYTIYIHAHYGSGADSGNTVYLSSHCQDDFDDVYFTDDTGGVLLSYWRETYTVEGHADFWVRVVDDLDSNQVIFIYYGNTGVSSTSSGVDTFIFFDDFETNNLTDRWDVVGSDWSTQSSVVKYGTYAAFGDSTGSPDRATIFNSINFTTGSNIMVHTWFRVTSIGVSSYRYATHFDWTNHISGVYARYNDWVWWNGGLQTWEANTVAANTWYECELGIDWTGEARGYEDPIIILWVDADDKGWHPLLDYSNAEVGWFDEVAMLTSGVSGPSNDQYQDDFYIRHWDDDEPEISSFGTEEEAPAEWQLVNSAIIQFVIGFDESSLWAINNWVIAVGLVMIPASTVYLAYGGRKKLSTDKVFFALLIFFLGIALVVGGAIG